MAERIPIDPVPNQSFSVVLEGAQYGIELKTAKGVTLITISRDGAIVVRDTRATSNSVLLQYRHLFQGLGNFVFVTLGERYPDYRRFGIDQSLVYITAAEVAGSTRPNFSEILQRLAA